MFAIIETGGKQIKVEPGNSIFIEKINGNVKDKIVFDKVLLIGDKIGTPYVKDVKISGTIEKQGKSKKIIIYRTKPKSNWKRKQGHRQLYTRVKIDNFK